MFATLNKRGTVIYFKNYINATKFSAQQSWVWFILTHSNNNYNSSLYVSIKIMFIHTTGRGIKHFINLM